MQASAEYLLGQILGITGPGSQSLEVSLGQLLAQVQAAQGGIVGNQFTAHKWYGPPDTHSINTFGGETQLGTTPNQIAVFEFQAAATNAVTFDFLVPSDWLSSAVDLILYQAKKDSQTGNIVHQLNTVKVAATDDITKAGTTIQQTIAVPVGAANLLQKITFAQLFSPTTVGELWRINYARLGGDGADSYPNNHYFVGIELQYQARTP